MATRATPVKRSSGDSGDGVTPAPTPALAAAPAGYGVLRLLLVGVFASVVYSAFSTSSLGVCLGSGSDIRSECVQIELSPQPYVFVLMAIVAVATILLVRLRGLHGTVARRVVTLGVLLIVLVALVFTVLHSLTFLRANIDIQQGVDIVLPFYSNATVTPAAP